MSRFQIRDNYWGKFRIPSYADNNTTEENIFLALRKLGYVSNEKIAFSSYKLIMYGNVIEEVQPYSVELNYKPKIIPWLLNSTVKLELYVEKNGCSINFLDVVDTILEFPKQKTEKTWKEYHKELINIFYEIEKKLLENKDFFSDNNYEVFIEKDFKWYTSDGTQMQFDKVRFGYRGDYWGTYWHKV